MKLLKSTALLILLAATVFSAHAEAQITASVVGTVQDPSGAAVSGAIIRIQNTSTGVIRTVTSDDAGQYSLSSLPIGLYRIECEKEGFRTAVQQDVLLQIGQTARAPFFLEIGQRQDSVTVEAQANLANTQSVVLSEIIENRRIVDLPLNGRQFLQLAELSPGVSRGASGGVRGGLTGNLTGPNITVNGARDTDNYYTVDGVTANDRFFNSLTFSPSVESIEEFHVQSGLYSAEHGVTGGAQINLVTRSGSNRFHGSLYEFLRNDRLNARNAFDIIDTDGDGTLDKPKYNQSQYGASFGGPLTPRRTFFFGNFEGLRIRVPQTQLLTVPTLRMRQGDFGELGDGDPNTRTDLDLRNPLAPGAPFAPPVFFAGNRIPANLWDPVAREMLSVIPAPNRPGVGSNFVAAPTSRTASDQFTIRIDHHYSDRNSFTGRFTFSDIEQFSPYGVTAGGGRGANPLPGFGWDLTTNNRNLSVNHTRIWTPRMVGEFRFGYNKVFGGQVPQNLGNDIIRRLNIRGLFAEGDQLGFPRFTVTGMSPFGDEPANLSRSNEDFQFDYKLSYNVGKHQWRWGFEYQRGRFAPTVSNNSRGFFQFGSAGNSSGFGFSDFLLGNPGQANAGNLGAMRFAGNEYFAYVQDTYQLYPWMTFNLGLRYEYQEPMVDENLTVATFNPRTRQIIIPSIDGRTAAASAFKTGTLATGYNVFGARFPIVTSEAAGIHPGLIQSDKNNFGPRVGMVFDSQEGIVIRTGYGVYFNRKEQFAMTLMNARPPFGFAGQRINLGPTPLIDAQGNRTTIANFLDTPVLSVILPIDPELRTGYLQQWNLNVQWEPSWGLVETGYAGSKGTKLFLIDSRNYRQAGGPAQSAEFFPYTLGMTVWSDFGFSNYHAWQTRLVYRLPGGGQLTGNYTLAKSMDNNSAGSSGTNDSDSGGISNPFNRAAEKARSAFDARHRAVVSGVWELPLARGTRWGGWQLGFLGSYRSATPFTVDSPRDFAGIGRSSANRPNLSGDPNNGPKTTAQWFNTSAFTNPAAGTFGNAGRNIVEADTLASIDLSVQKDWTIREDVRLQFRWEVFNVGNHANFATPLRSYLPRDGTAGVSNNVNPDFGRVPSAFDPRVMQAALKLVF